MQAAFLFQIVQQFPHLAHRLVLHQAVGAQPVQAQIQQPLFPAAPQSLHHQVFAHIIAQLLLDAQHAGQGHLGRNRYVLHRKFAQAVAAVLTAGRMLLPEIVQDIPPRRQPVVLQ